jgi:hypothetical protein
MTPTRWLCGAAVMTLALCGSFAGAQTPSACCKEHAKLEQCSYVVADLITYVGSEEQLIQSIMQVTGRQHWQEHGGCGKIDYFPVSHCLVVEQLPETQERLSAYLAALRHIAAKKENAALSGCCAAAPCCLPACCLTAAPCCTAAACSSKPCCATAACACPECQKGEACSCPNCKGCDACNCGKPKAACACPQCQKGESCACPNCKGCDACNCGKSKGCDACSKHAAARTQPKQYGHFIMDNVTINAMGVSAKIKRIRILYKGEGVDSDIAKCALTDGESEKKVDSSKLDTLIEKLSELLEKKTPTSMASPCLPGSAIGAAVGAVTGSAICPAACPLTSCTGISSMPTCAPCPTTATTATTNSATTWTRTFPTAAPAPPKPLPVECEEDD